MDRTRLYISTIDANAGTLARRYGLGVEVADFCTASNMDQGFSAVDARVRQTLDGVRRRVLHGPFNELFPCAIDPKARALAKSRYLQAAALAADYGIRRMVLHAGFIPQVYYPVWFTEQSARFWRELLEELPKDFEILLENVLEDTPELLTAIARAVDDPRLRLCLDVGHANVASKVPVLDWLEKCAPWLDHFHLHNNDGAWDTHSPLDNGTVPIKDLLARAAVLCPGATYTLELTDSQDAVRLVLEGDSSWNDR